MLPNQTKFGESLSPREQEIARAYANGDNYRKIANDLFIAPTTVRTHLATIYRKLGVSSKLELHNVLEDGAASATTQSDQEALVSELALSLEEALSRERALGEILRIINGAQGELDEVISSLLTYALDLCDAEFGAVFEYTGTMRYRAAFTKGIPADFQKWFLERGEFQVDPATGLGRVAAMHALVNIPDVRGEELYRRGDPLREATADIGGARSFTAIPMLAGSRLIGAFTIYRQQLRPFDNRNLELAQMFADQSVIAIENARLLSEARSRNTATRR